MRRAIATMAFAGLVSLPVGAQAQVSIYGDQGIPASSMPPPGACRVWYDGLQPSQQSPIVNCRDAERMVAGDRRARVIYGGVPDPTTNARWDREGARYSERMQSLPIATATFSGFDRVSFENGYNDGLEQGREDARDRDGYDPARHSRFKNADHKYDKDSGSKDRYKAVFRNGFLDGYAAGYSSVPGTTTTRVVYLPR